MDDSRAAAGSESAASRPPSPRIREAAPHLRTGSLNRLEARTV
jgi:hypothetical protein